MQHIMDLRDSSDDERSFIDMTGDSDGERRPEPRVSGGGARVADAAQGHRHEVGAAQRS